MTGSPPSGPAPPQAPRAGDHKRPPDPPPPEERTRASRTSPPRRRYPAPNDGVEVKDLRPLTRSALAGRSWTPTPQPALPQSGSSAVSVVLSGGAAQPARPLLPGQGRLRRRCAMALRATLDPRASAAPPGSIAGRPEPALHHAQRPRTAQLSWTDQHIAPLTQVRTPAAN